MRHRCRRWLLALAATLVVTTGVARGDDRYYAIVFGSQSHPKLLRLTHSWITFVRVSGESADPNALWVGHHSISWLPATLDIKVWSPTPEPGVNLDVYQTLQFVKGQGQSVTAWGPFQITPEVYQKSLDVMATLESGRAQYRAISGRRNLLIADCIHAVAAIDPEFGRDHYPLIRVGKPASRHIAREMVLRGHFDQKQVDAPWLIPRLGLDSRGIEIVPPRSIPERPCGLCRIPESCSLMPATAGD